MFRECKNFENKIKPGTDNNQCKYGFNNMCCYTKKTEKTCFHFIMR